MLDNTLAAEGDEVHKTPEGKADIKATAGENKFTLIVNYGDNVEASNDTFKFKLDPATQSILDQEGNPLVKFQITSGNRVSLPADLLQEKLSEVLVKYRGQAAAAEPVTSLEETQDMIPEVTSGRTFTINGLGEFEFLGVDSSGFVHGGQKGTKKMFKRDRVLQDNPGFFNRQPRQSQPQGTRPYSEAKYRKILQGAVDDAGSTEFAYDMADSMIHDPQILARLAKDHPGKSAKDLKQILQWDIEACEAPDNDDDYDNEVAETITEHGDHKFTEEDFAKLKQAYADNGLGGLKTGLTDSGDIHVYVSSDAIFDKAWEVAKNAGLKAWEIQFAERFGGAGLNYVAEKLGPNSKPETYIKDFEKSDAPQFKGKSKEKKRQMAIAAFLNKNEALDPVGQEDEDIDNNKIVNSTDKYLAKRREAISKNMKEDLDLGHQDDEPGMLKGNVYQIAKNAVELYKALQAFEGHGEVDFPHWWQSKIIRAADDIQCAKEYLEFETKEPAIDAAINTLGEGKGTCCHKCGHVHVKGTSHPTPYLTGQKNCKFRD